MVDADKKNSRKKTTKKKETVFDYINKGSEHISDKTINELKKALKIDEAIRKDGQ